MKKALLVVLAVILVLIAVVLVAPFLIPVDTYKRQIAQQVEAQTGRELRIDGEVSLSVLPRTQLTAERVAFANADWADEAQMVELNRLQVRVNPFALLSGNLQVESFVLEQPVIHLAVDEQGRGNWSFAETGAPAGGESGGGSSTGGGESQDGAGGTGPLKDIGLKDVRLVDGRITYTDKATGRHEEVTGVNLSLALEGLDEPFSADGGLTWNDETLSLDLETGPPRKLMAGEVTDVTLSLESNPVTLDYAGQVANATPRRVQGEVTIDIPSLKGLAAWAGSPVAAAEGTLEQFHLAGQVDAEGDTYAFAAKEILLDQIEGKGDLSVDLGGQKPALSGRLDLAKMDITPYLPAPTEKGGAGGGSKTGTGGSGGSGDGGAPAGWSDEPIDMSPLQAANVDFDLNVEGIKAREVKVGRSALSLQLQDGRLQADLNKLNLYGGKGTGRIVVNARKETPSIAKTFEFEGLNAKPFLTDVAGFERLEGTGNMSIDVTASGKSQKALVNDLDGKGAIRFTDGAVTGFNLAQMVRNVKSAFTETGGTQKTDFAELAGTFTITDGVLKNDDLLLLNPLLRVRGEGQADIAERTVNYCLTPKAVSTIEGQGGSTQETGIAVPVIVEGPWHDISYRPDLESVIRDAVKDPGKIKEQIEKIREGGDLGSILEGVGGSSSAPSDGGGGKNASGKSGGGKSGSGKSSGDSEKPLKKEAEDALKKLFGD